MEKKLIIFILFFALLTTTFAQEVQPPREEHKKEADLVELIKLDRTIKLDIRYATSNNFVGKPVYSEAKAFLQRPAAEALVRVHRKLKKMGLGLVIFDAYRPWSVTKLFWEFTPPEKRNFVADPAKGSKHNRGCAVDLSLYDLKTGKLLPMPSEYDEFTERSSPTYQGGTEEERRNRDLLIKVMQEEGFTVNPYEWWHFDYKDWQEYAIYDIPFSEIKSFSKKIKSPKSKNPVKNKNSRKLDEK
jgi:zinc D-Ala-D-Ala dipeptidase